MKGAKPLSQSDQPKPANRPKQPFDGYDDVAEGITEPHTHPVIADEFTSGTGRKLMTAAIVLAVVLGGAFLLVSGIKAHDQAQLAAATEAKTQEAPIVEVMVVGAGAPEQTLRLPAEARGWYTSTIYARVSGYLTRPGSSISATGSKNSKSWPRSIPLNSTRSSKLEKRSSRLPRPS